MKPGILVQCCAFAVFLAAHTARAVIFASTADPMFNTTAPSGSYAGSGWEFQGQYQDFTGIPIAPQYFITAKHFVVPNGTPLIYLGQSYATDAVFDAPDSDLRIWHVTTPFPSHAPLYTRGDEIGKELVVFGRGLERGVEIAGKGWLWGTMLPALRWGTNTVSGVVNAGAGFGSLIEAKFDIGASANEATLTVRDSGGGVFIKDTDGVWKLAGVNFAVSGPYKASAGDTPFNAALYDQSAYLAEQFDGSFASASGPGSFYATRISANMPFIQQVTGVPEPSVGASALAALVWCMARRRR